MWIDGCNCECLDVELCVCGYIFFVQNIFFLFRILTYRQFSVCMPVSSDTAQLFYNKSCYLPDKAAIVFLFFVIL